MTLKEVKNQEYNKVISVACLNRSNSNLKESKPPLTVIELIAVKLNKLMGDFSFNIYESELINEKILNAITNTCEYSRLNEHIQELCVI